MSYLLDMGEPIKIIDLAEQIIKFSGLEPYKDIDIKIVGSRKGERITEPLWLEEEKPVPTKYKKILKLENKPYEQGRLERLLEQLRPVCFFEAEKEKDFRNKERLLELLCEDCATLRDFYREAERDGQPRTDLL